MLWLIIHNRASGFPTKGHGGRYKRWCLEDRPAPTVMAYGIYGDNQHHHHIVEDGIEFVAPREEKPPYRVPSMAEVAAVEPNGYEMVSTFSGAGGSCLGYKMAGFRCLLASEFVPAAREVYEANFPGVPVDGGDIREVTAEDILTRIGKGVGELDVLEGSPPCASFSTAGKREKGWGKVRSYSDVEQRSDDLFFEFARLLKGIQPRAFSAENVTGLVKGAAKGYFKMILTALEEAGYVVRASKLDSQWLGVPQARQRIFFVGMRKDLGVEPRFPTPLPYRYSVREALPHILRHGTAVNYDRFEESHRDLSQTMVDSDAHPAPTILQAGVNIGAGLVDALPVEEGEVVHDSGYYDEEGRPKRRAITDDVAPTVMGPTTASHWTVEKRAPNDIEGTAIGREYDGLREGEQSDRYFNLVRADGDRPSPTVTAAGGGRGVAAVVHPTERRKFTIAELKRICAFPDDFVLSGTYPQQWERLGRAVPPLMARAVADKVAEALREADGR